MSTKRMNLVSRDIISGLPESLICHILSFVCTKQSAYTSVMAKRWRNLYTLLPNLDLDDSVYLNPENKITTRTTIPRSFVDFVDRVLVLQDVPLNRFSLKCNKVVHSAIIIGWILKVLDHGVVDLDLEVSTKLVYPSEMFLSKTLVKLKLVIRDDLIVRFVKDVCLPKLKILCLEYDMIFNGLLAAKLIPGCPALEEVVLTNGSRSLTSRTHTTRILPPEIFLSKTLVKLKVRLRDDLIINVKEVLLPNIKSLCLDNLMINESLLAKLMSGCQALEEVVLTNGSCSLTSRTHKTKILPPEIFLSKTLVKLKVRLSDDLIINVKEVFLPKIKSLCLDNLMINESLLAKLMSGCQALEELALNDMICDFKESFSVISTTLKRLTFCRSKNFDQNHKIMLFYTPNLVYLKYSDTIADKYMKVSFSSLVEASLGLRISVEHVVKTRFSYGDLFEEDMVAMATDFLMGISNVKVLYLSNDTLEVLTYCCKAIPKFNNLIHLTIETDPSVGWESLPTLLKNCPKLQTLVFEGLHHKFTKCAEPNGCLCKLWEDNPTCLSSSPVKVVKIFKFGEICGVQGYRSLYYILEEQINQVKHFLETMPNLEELILYLDTSFDGNVTELSNELRMLTNLASPKCKVQLLPSNLQ